MSLWSDLSFVIWYSSTVNTEESWFDTHSIFESDRDDDFQSIQEGALHQSAFLWILWNILTITYDFEFYNVKLLYKQICSLLKSAWIFKFCRCHIFKWLGSCIYIQYFISEGFYPWRYYWQCSMHPFHWSTTETREASNRNFSMW